MSSFQIKFDAIDRLEKSTTFPKNTLYFKILRYLVQEEEAGKKVKSSTIAMDVLAPQDGVYSSNYDSLIRNKLYTLRKELKLFYFTEGKEDDIKLSIPKGAYQVEISQIDKNKTANKNSENTSTSKSWKSYLFPSITVVLLMLVSYQFFFQASHNPVLRTSLVSLLMDSDESLDIILGGREFYLEYDTQLKRRRFIYDTEPELPWTFNKMNAIMSKYPERHIHDHTETIHSDADHLILTAELKSEWNMRHQESHIFQSQYVKKIKNNSVFIGGIKEGSLFDLSSYFTHSKFIFKTPGLLGYITHFAKRDGTLLKLGTEYEKDTIGAINNSYYYIIKKVMVEGGKQLLFLLSSHRADRKYMNHIMFSPDFHKEILSSFKNGVPDEFELLLKIKGSRRMGSSHTIIYNSASN